MYQCAGTDPLDSHYIEQKQNSKVIEGIGFFFSGKRKGKLVTLAKLLKSIPTAIPVITFMFQVNSG